MYDLIVIGGGIVGLATAQRYIATHPGRDVLLLEKEPQLCAHQSGRNSGVLHSGVYYKPGSRKALNCRRGKQLMESFCREMGVPFERCGKLIVAVEESELPRLAELERRGIANGTQVLRMNSRELEAVEPRARGVAALHVPETGIVDFARVGAALAERLVDLGGEVGLGVEVLQIETIPTHARVHLDGQSLEARHVIVCAGLQADRLAHRAGLARHLRVVPFRGDYRSLRSPHASSVKGLIYPVPDPRFPFLGVHLTRRIDGGVDAGPNAVPALAREARTRLAFNVKDAWSSLSWPGLWRLILRHPRLGLREMHGSMSSARFASAAGLLVPALEESWLERAPSGVRAQLLDRSGRLVDDFTLARDGCVLHLLNAPSPAATASLAIADDLLSEVLGDAATAVV